MPEGPFLVVGLARSGAAVARMLAARGEHVLGCDSAHPPEAEGLSDAGVEVKLDGDGTELLQGVKTVVKSPGVPADAPVIEAAREREIPVLGELEVAWRAIPNRFIAVTGTNGKTTTTEMIGHVYRTAAEPVAVAGNVGTPLASLAGSIDPEATVVCECSSFQLQDAELFAPECALFLNLAADHLDRHGDVGSYLEAKLGIFANQANEDVAIVNGDEAVLADRDLGGCARRVRFCRERHGDPDCELTLKDEVLFWNDDPLLNVSELPLPGDHNVENAMAAAAACLAMDISPGAVAEGLRSFAGVPHRLEPVAEIDGLTFVNDSKATNVASAAVGIRAFRGGVRVILGGSLKGGGFEELVEPVAERCVACYLIGEAAERLAADLGPAREAGVELHRAGDLATAVQQATAAAAPGEVVLLSPACASFDAYPDFEARGEHFRTLVEAVR